MKELILIYWLFRKGVIGGPSIVQSSYNAALCSVSSNTFFFFLEAQKSVLEEDPLSYVYMMIDIAKRGSTKCHNDQKMLKMLKKADLAREKRKLQKDDDMPLTNK